MVRFNATSFITSTLKQTCVQVLIITNPDIELLRIFCFFPFPLRDPVTTFISVPPPHPLQQRVVLFSFFLKAFPSLNVKVSKIESFELAYTLVHLEYNVKCTEFGTNNNNYLLYFLPIVVAWLAFLFWWQYLNSHTSCFQCVLKKTDSLFSELFFLLTCHHKRLTTKEQMGKLSKFKEEIKIFTTAYFDTNDSISSAGKHTSMVAYIKTELLTSHNNVTC